MVRSEEKIVFKKHKKNGHTALNLPVTILSPTISLLPPWDVFFRVQYVPCSFDAVYYKHVFRTARQTRQGAGATGTVTSSRYGLRSVSATRTRAGATTRGSNASSASGSTPLRKASADGAMAAPPTPREVTKSWMRSSFNK